MTARARVLGLCAVSVQLLWMLSLPSLAAGEPLVAFTTSTATGTDIRMLFADGSVSDPIEPDSVEPRTFSVSPDGTRLAFVGNGSACTPAGCSRTPSTLFIMNVDGSALQPVYVAEEGTDFLSEPEWSPDGQSIMFVSMPEQDESGARPNTDIWSVKQDAVGAWTAAPLLVRAGNEFSPEWSPDGKQIAYEYDPNPDGKYRYRDGDERAGRIWLSDADGSGPHLRLTGGPGFHSNPAFSPDGRRITYVAAPSMWSVKEWDIRIMRRDGSSDRKIASDRFESWGLHFHPQGRRIVFGEGYGLDAGRLMTVTVAAPHRMRVLFDSPDFDYYPEYFPAS